MRPRQLAHWRRRAEKAELDLGWWRTEAAQKQILLDQAAVDANEEASRLIEERDSILDTGHDTGHELYELLKQGLYPSGRTVLWADDAKAAIRRWEERTWQLTP